MYGRPIPEEDREIIKNTPGTAKQWLWSLLPTEEERMARLLGPTRGGGSSWRGGSRVGGRIGDIRGFASPFLSAASAPALSLATSSSTPVVDNPSTVFRGCNPCENCRDKAIELARYGRDRDADLLMGRCRCLLKPQTTLAVASQIPPVPLFFDTRLHNPVMLGILHDSDSTLRFLFIIGFRCLPPLTRLINPRPENLPLPGLLRWRRRRNVSLAML
jgi:hypothetical protein